MTANFFTRLFRLTDIKEKGDGKKLLLRYMLSAIGVVVIGLGCGIVVEMAVGCDTYTCFVRSVWYILTDTFGEFPFGHINLTSNFVIFMFMILAKRELIGFGTLFNMVTVGYIIDFVHYFFGTFLTPGTELGYILRIVIIIIALPVIALGDALYFRADLGVSPYDGIAFMLEKATKGKVSFKVLRTVSDCFFVVVGFLLGFVTGKQFELANVGTVILALFTGSLIVFWQKVLRGRNKCKEQNS